MTGTTILVLAIVAIFMLESNRGFQLERRPEQVKNDIWISEDWAGYESLLSAESVKPLSLGNGSCNKHIVDHIQSLLTGIPPALTIPYGRAYVAVRYGVALYLDRSPAAPQVGDVLTLVVKTCVLPPPEKHFDIAQPAAPSQVHDNGECGISLYARLLGPEVVMGSVDLVQVRGALNHSSCEWHVTFPIIQIAGSYQLEILKMWLNEIDEPDAKTRNRNKDERVNDGNIVNLSGTGSHHFYILNATMHYFPDLFEGIIARPSSAKNLYLVSNGTSHGFDNWNVFVGLGYTNDDVVSLLDAFFWQHFAHGFSIASVEGNEQFRKGTDSKSKILPADAMEIVHAMTRTHILSFESRARREGMVFGLPANINFSHSVKPFSPSSTRICTAGDEQGRWTYEPVCQYNVTVGYLESVAGRGHECRQTIAPVMDHWDFDFKTRLRYHVWRPYNCSLVQLRQDAWVDPRLSYCDNVRAYLMRGRAVGGRPSTSIEPTMQNVAGRGLIKVQSMLAYALRSTGIASIIGFGDSLGEEQRDNIIAMLGILSWNTDGSNANAQRPRGVICMGDNHNRIHQLVDENFALAGCVERSVMSTNPDPIFTPDELAARPGANQSYVNATTIVLVTNFMSQHSVWIHSLGEIVDWLNKQGKAHEAVTQRLAARGVQYRKIFMSSIHIHGFRTGGLTPGRSRFFNDQAIEILGKFGWEILDTFNMSRPRPDGSVDGVHPRGGVSIAITDMMLNMIVNKDCGFEISMAT